MSGAHEPRRRFALTGGVFSAPESRGTRVALAIRPIRAAPFLHQLTGYTSCVSNTLCLGGKIFAEPQRRAALCGARETAASAAGTKRTGHLRFPFLVELLPFPYLLARRKSESGDRSENGVRQRIFSSVGAASGRPFPYLHAMPDSILLHMWFHLRKRG